MENNELTKGINIKYFIIRILFYLFIPLIAIIIYFYATYPEINKLPVFGIFILIFFEIFIIILYVIFEIKILLKNETSNKKNVKIILILFVGILLLVLFIFYIGILLFGIF